MIKHILVLLPLVACTSPSAPVADRISHDVCNIARNAEYFGEFRLVSVGPKRDEFANSAVVRLERPIVAAPPNLIESDLPRGLPPGVAGLRSAKVGEDFEVLLSMPRHPRLVTGSRVLLFLKYSYYYNSLMDNMGQGLFETNASGGLENGWSYDETNPAAPAQLFAEATRGFSLPRSGSPRCDEGFVGLAGGGSAGTHSTADAGE